MARGSGGKGVEERRCGSEGRKLVSGSPVVAWREQVVRVWREIEGELFFFLRDAGQRLHTVVEGI